MKQKLDRYEKTKVKSTKSDPKQDIINEASKYVNSNVLSFLAMQLNHDKQRKWEEPEKQFALGLYYKSPKAYQFLRDFHKFALPSISLIRKWVNVINLRPGKNEQLSNQLKLKLQGKTDFEKEAILMWDEMSLKPGLEYNLKEDYIEGYHDLNGYGEREQKMAKSVLVFMVTGLTHDWKQPFMFFPTNGPVPGNILQTIVCDVLQLTEDIGFKVRHMVCDQGASNQKAIAMLKIDKNRPFFEFQSRKITFAFDGPHIFKCIRNNLIKNDIKIGNDTISWNAVRELREIECSKVCKAAPKLTDRHVNPNNFEKMKVSLATQVFSNSVYAALMAGAISGDLKNQSTVATANFCKRLNDVFDCLNARSANDRNPLKRGLSEKNPQVEKCLRDAVTWFEQWQMSNGKNPDCFNSIILTINATLELWTQLKNEGKPYVLTSRLNQDKLENFFGTMRSRSGHNDNPTVMQFRRNFQYALMITLLVPPVGTNCEPDDARLLISSFDKCINEDALKEKEDLKNLKINKQIDEWFINNDAELILNDEQQLQTNEEVKEKSSDFQNCSKKYVAGYLAFKNLQKFNCDECKKDFICNDNELDSSSDLLLLWKAFPSLKGQPYGSLKAPTQIFFSIILDMYSIYESEFCKISHMHNVAEYLYQLIKKQLLVNYSIFFGNDACLEHRDYVIKFFLKTHIFNNVKWMTKDFRDRNVNKRSASVNAPKRNKKMLKLDC